MKVKQWLKEKWAAFKAWVYALLVTLGVIVGGIATADDVNLSWDNATQNTDGSALPIEDIAETVLYKQSFPLGTDVSAVGRSYVELDRMPATVTSYVDANQPNGIHCYVGIHIHVNGQTSADSNESCKTIDVRIPGSPNSMNAN